MKPPSGLPDNVNGEDYPGLLLVDGITIVAPLLDALSMPVIDVPLVVGSMAQVRDGRCDADVRRETTPLCPYLSDEWHRR